MITTNMTICDARTFILITLKQVRAIAPALNMHEEIGFSSITYQKITYIYVRVIMYGLPLSFE